MSMIPLRILHVTEDHSKANTGVTAVVNQLSGWQARHVDWVGIFATGNMRESHPDMVNWFPETITPRAGPLRTSRTLKKNLIALIREHGVNIIHIHGVWRTSTLAGAKIAGTLGIPSVLTVHGMLEPWALQGQGMLKTVKKKLYWRLATFPALRHVNLVHAITLLEKEQLSRLFPGRQVEVIPNAVDLPDECSSATGAKMALPHRKILFAGRLHPKKGVDMLIRAFMSADLSHDWQLVITGPAEVPEYLAGLEKIVENKRAGSVVEFTGPLYGAALDRMYRSAWVVAVPSLSEVVGMVNLEAAARNTPSITTVTTGLGDWEQGGGLLVKPEEYAIRAALAEACSWSIEERLDRGRKSRMLVETRYSARVTGRQWLELYQGLAADPSCEKK